MTTKAPGWSVLGASVAGTSHLKQGRGCDDAHAYRLTEDNRLCLAVADGAGSAQHSARAARVAVACAVEQLDLLTRQGIPTSDAGRAELMLCILRAVRDAIEDLAAQPDEDSPTVGPNAQHSTLGGADARAEDTHPPWIRRVGSLIKPGASSPSPPSLTASGAPQPLTRLRLREFATTLLVAIAMEDVVVSVQVGDGAIVVETDEEKLWLTLQPPKGEYINEADFLTDDDCEDRARMYVHEANITALVLLTDGMEFLAIDQAAKEPHAPFFSPLLTFARKAEANQTALADFLQSERVSVRTDDDKTLLVAVRAWRNTSSAKLKPSI